MGSARKRHQAAAPPADGSTPEAGSEPGTGDVGGSLKIGMNSVVDGLTPFAIQGYVWSQMLGFVFYDPLIKKDGRRQSRCRASPGEVGHHRPVEDGPHHPRRRDLPRRHAAHGRRRRVLDRRSRRRGADRVDRGPPDHDADAMGVGRGDRRSHRRGHHDRARRVPRRPAAGPDRAQRVVRQGQLRQRGARHRPVHAQAASPAAPASKAWRTTTTGTVAPAIDELSFAFFADPATASTGLRSGQVDGALRRRPCERRLGQRRGRHDGRLRGRHLRLLVDPPDGQGAARRSRGAQRAALLLRHRGDQQRVVQGQGQASTPGTRSTCYPTNDGPDVDDVTYDPAKAKAAAGRPRQVRHLGADPVHRGLRRRHRRRTGASSSRSRRPASRARWRSPRPPTGSSAPTPTGRGKASRSTPATCRSRAKNFYDYLVNPSTILKSAYKDGDVVPEVAELYRKIKATPFDYPRPGGVDGTGREDDRRRRQSR